MNDFYASHSPVSDPGRHAALFDSLPRDVAGVSAVAQGLVYHYVADEQFFGFKPPQERLPEIDTRSIEGILGRLIEMDNRPLDQPRAFDKRIIGCCRDFALLACAMLRQAGIPARVRHGFAGYFVPGWWIDHVVVEVWEGNRWRRFDAEVPPGDHWRFNIQDMQPDDPFVTGGRAWLMIRREGADPSRFGLGPDVPDVCGRWFIIGRMQQDMAALNKQEMLCWDQWRYGTADAVLTAEDEALLDRAAELSLENDSAALRGLCASDERLQVPARVVCWSPATGPHEVTL